MVLANLLQEGGGGGGREEPCDGLAFHPGGLATVLVANATDTGISSGLRGHLAQTQIFPTYNKPIVFKDVFHTNKCYDHVMTGLLVEK